MRRKIIAVCLSAAVALSALAAGGTADAAAKPKLKTKKISVLVKKSKTIKIAKKGKFKISFQSKNKKIAKVSSKGKVTGVKKGRTKVVVYYKKGKAAKKKLGTVSVTVTSKSTPTPVPPATISAAPPASTPNTTGSPAPAPSQAPGGQTPATETPIPTPE